MTRIRPFELAALVSCLLMLVFAQAAGSELKPDSISPAHRSGSEPHIVSDGSGNVVAVWRDLDDDTAVIRAAFRPRNGSFGPAQKISLPAVAAESPKVAMDRLGNAVAVWQLSTTGRDSVVQTAIRPAGGEWSPPQDVSDPTEPAFSASVSISAGQITAVWVSRHNWQPVIRTSSRTMTDTWSPAETISGPIGGSYEPTVVTDDQGGALAAWQWFDGSYLVIQASIRSSDGIWSQPEQLSGPGRHASAAVVAMDGAGNAIAGWIRSNGTAPAAQISTRAADGSWTPPRNLSRRGRNASSIDIAMNRRGDAIVGWVQGLGLATAFRVSGAKDWNRASVSQNWYGLQARIALDEVGNATAVWDVGYAISASYKPEGKAWQDDYLLSGYSDESGFSSSSAVTAQSPDNAMAVWVRSNENDDRIEAVGYDVDTSAREHEDEGDDEGDDDGGDDGGDDGEAVQGTPHADVLVGTPGDDVFYGRGGNDVIVGRGGRDVVYGGPGNDLIVGGRGSDRLLGGAGRDCIFGGHGNDRLRGGSGQDVLRGGSGDDVLRASDRSRDRAFGGSGLDQYQLDGWLDRARSIESRL